MRGGGKVSLYCAHQLKYVLLSKCRVELQTNIIIHGKHQTLVVLPGARRGCDGIQQASQEEEGGEYVRGQSGRTLLREEREDVAGGDRKG